MSIPKFTLGGNELLFPLGVQTPGNEPVRKIQAIDRTAAGSLQVESFGVTTREIVLVFRGMDKATTYASLEVWFDTISDGALNEFVYTDGDSVDHTVQIMSPALNFTEIEPGLMEGSLTLEEV